MSKLLKQGRKLVRVGRKLALATAACIARCCGGEGLYYVLKLCGTVVPPNVPQFIAVRVPFECGGCPLNTGRIVVYRGHCYVAQGQLQCLYPLDCAGGKCEADKSPLRDIGYATVVLASDLVCKPLDTTCETVPCVPTEPGCCTAWIGGPCPDNYQCRYPKRFRISRLADYHTKNSYFANTNPTCTGYTVCADLRIRVNISGEYQCVEDQGQFSQATLRSVSGSVEITGFTAAGYPGIDGTYPATNQGLGGLFDGGYSLCSFGNWVQCGAFDLRGALDFLIGEHCSGVHDVTFNDPSCQITDATTCANGTRIRSQRGTCLAGYINHQEYQNCSLCLMSHTANGNFVPPCSTLPYFEEQWNDQAILSSLIGCETVSDTDYQNPGDPISDGSFLRGTSPTVIRQTVDNTFGGRLY